MVFIYDNLLIVFFNFLYVLLNNYIFLVFKIIGRYFIFIWKWFEIYL